jgi:hypothetical protein
MGNSDMAFLRKFGLGAAAAAMTVTAISPAMARDHGGHGYGYGGYGSYGGHHRGHHDNDTGEILGGVLIGAILVGVLASASKKSKQNRRDSGNEYPQRGTNSADGRSGSIGSEDQAVDACATAAEQKAGRSSSVRDIKNVRRSDDGWDVEGVVESRSTWRDKSATNRNFTCSVRYGSVETIYVEDRSVAADDQDVDG